MEISKTRVPSASTAPPLPGSALYMTQLSTFTVGGLSGQMFAAKSLGVIGHDIATTFKLFKLFKTPEMRFWIGFALEFPLGASSKDDGFVDRQDAQLQVTDVFRLNVKFPCGVMSSVIKSLEEDEIWKTIQVEESTSRLSLRREKSMHMEAHPIVNILESRNKFTDAVVQEALPDNRDRFRKYFSARPLKQATIGIRSAVGLVFASALSHVAANNFVVRLDILTTAIAEQYNNSSINPIHRMLVFMCLGSPLFVLCAQMTLSNPCPSSEHPRKRITRSPP
ncbi:hypothetical protein B0J13DRAFT_626666 [Dactylonectria estremocensis]|uniref:Uncharacterized protein n=1 Tax=Dactylonectria estremocensis TaxID=1079267 RepID=A0A9P9ISF0_9HYPO|nr:hypothetical protein B0J13DRAFT_626666 [Dactylonectria estremocensis]